ncbi:MAG TPA: hypothetical protein VI168_12880 [Croceibacterium sp.]
MKLARSQYYLRVQSAADTESDSFSLCIATDLKALLKDWDASTRISPIWKLKPDGGNAAMAEVEGDAEVLFLSATPEWLATHLSTSSMSLLGDDSIWLSLGFFSLIIVSCHESVSAETKELCKRHSVPYEVWFTTEPPVIEGEREELLGDRIISENPAEFSSSAALFEGRESQLLFERCSVEVDNTFGLLALEFYALLAVIERRAIGHFVPLARDCLDIDTSANALISKDISEGNVELIDAPLAQGALLTLNAALSRMSSQALSGTSPIIRTESHFWPHSFLGIGVASLALRNLAKFTTTIVEQSHYHPSYDALLDQPTPVSSDHISQRTTDHPLHLQLKPESISSLPALSSASPTVGEGDENERYRIATPVTYFSGRDGFRNDALTISAPLPCVSGCNSYQWNLGTVTHELSHRILSGKLQDLFDGLLERMHEIPRGDPNTLTYFTEPPTNIRHHAEDLLGFTLMLFHINDYDTNDWKSHLAEPGSFFEKAKRTYSSDFEEALVHMFDYYHFYGSDPKSYVEFIWLSWAIQPTIIEKLDEYVKRTLTALAVRNLTAANWRELTLADFVSVLEDAPLATSLSIKEDLLTRLGDETHRQRYMFHLERMQYLLTLFHLLLKSDKLRDLAQTEDFHSPKTRTRRSGERRRFNYSATAGTFHYSNPGVPPTRFTNPLLFLRDFSREEQPSAAQSAWLLHMLAFNCVARPDGSERAV